MSQKSLRVAACQMHADENIEKNTCEVIDRLNTCAREKSGYSRISRRGFIRLYQLPRLLVKPRSNAH